MDTLTRKPNKRPTEDKDKQRQYCMHVLLLPNWINYEAELQPIEENDEDYANQTNSDTDSNASDNKTSLLSEWVIESNQNNELCNKICLYLTNSKGLDKPDAYLKSLRVENKLLMKGSQLWVADEGQL